ncbi:MAG: cytochrome c3 family protein [bacterium]
MGTIKGWIKANVVLSIAIVVVVIYGMKLCIDFTSNPIFCKGLCHDMAPDVDSYRASFHGSGNNGKPLKHNGHKSDCHGCHYTPGVVGLIKGKIAAVLVSVPHEITGHRGEPFSELSEKEQKEILPQYVHEPTTTFFFKAKGEKFICPPHGESRRIINEQCKWCHEDKTGMINANALLDAQKDVEKDPNAPAPENKAKVESNTGLKENFSAVPGAHASHEDKGAICLDCHQEIAHAPESLGISPMNLPRMEICFHCHNDEKAFKDDCEKCHIGQVNMHKGIAAKDVEDMPGIMADMATGCADCGHSEGNNFKADNSTCDGCHDEGYQDMVEEWQSDYEVSVAPVKVLLKDVEKLLKKASKKRNSNTAEARELFNSAKYNYDYAVKDGSRGGHNFDYTDAMLEKAKEKLEEAKDLLSKKHG